MSARRILRLAPPVLAAGLAASLILAGVTRGYTTLGFALGRLNRQPRPE